MKKIKIIWPICAALFLGGLSAMALLDTFVLERTYQSLGEAQRESIQTEIEVSEKAYTVKVNKYREYDTDIYVADIVVSSPAYLKTALAENKSGRNIKEKTSVIAQRNNAEVAINGDFYGAQEKGTVIREGVLYRDDAREGRDLLVIYQDGRFDIMKDGTKTGQELLEDGAWNVLGFGPGLVKDGEVLDIPVSSSRQMNIDNPRTGIGMIDETHYLFVVVDGRSRNNAGVTLKKLAEFMQKLGAKVAYNLDGGGSSAMYYQGKIINNPTTTGHEMKEREVSDIVYIGGGN